MNIPNLSVVKGFFAKYAVVGLLLVIAAGATYHLVTVVTLKGVNNELRATITALNAYNGRIEAENAGLSTTNENFKTAADAQNKAFTDLLLVVSNTQKRTFEELTRVNAEAHKYKDAYTKIFNATPVSADPCVSAEDVIKKYLAQRKKEAVSK